MTAVQARALTEAILQLQGETKALTLKIICERIKDAAKMGTSKIRFAVPYLTNDSVISTIAKQLADDGFTVAFEPTVNHEKGLIIVTW